MRRAGAPPFRAEHIGSLLRPERLIAARRRFGAGEIGRDEVAAIEDEAILAAVRLQEAAGFAVVTDGEFRRPSYHGYFYSRLGDITIDEAEHGPAEDRHYTYEPTFILRGLTDLHIKFTPAG